MLGEAQRKKSTHVLTVNLLVKCQLLQIRLCHYNEFDFFIKKKQFFTKIGTFRMLYLHLTKFRHAESVLMVERDKS